MNWEAFGAIGEILGDVFLKANENIDTLKDNEPLRLLIGMQRIYRVWEEACHQHTAGRLDAPGFSVFWELRKQHYDVEFREYIDALPRSSRSLHENQADDS